MEKLQDRGERTIKLDHSRRSMTCEGMIAAHDVGTPAAPTRARAAFSSLRNPNLRLYFAAQVASNIGSWIQITAENWLVLRLGGSGLALGITNALQFGPLLFLGLYGGVIADRLDRRRLLMATQGALAALSVAVGVLVATGRIELWMVWGAALLFGLVTCADRPALEAFVKDLAGDADLPNAIALDNVTVAAGRMVGPAVSGLLITSFGLTPGFFINAATFLAVVLALSALDPSRLNASEPVARHAGQLREGLSYIQRDPVLLRTVEIMSVVFTAAYNFEVLVTLLAASALGGASMLYGALMSCLGLGAVVGSLLIAAWVRTGVTVVAALSAAIGVVYALLALSFGYYSAVGGMILLGVACGIFNVAVSSTLQLRARDGSRGLVMATYSMGVLGTGFIGAPLAGTLADDVGVRGTFVLIAATCIAAAVATLAARSRASHRAT